MFTACCDPGPAAPLDMPSAAESVQVELEPPGSVASELLGAAKAAALRAGLPQPFAALLVRYVRGEPLGLELDPSDAKTLRVCGLRPEEGCPVQRYNANAAEGQQVLVGDHVLSVNEVTGSAEAMADKMRSSLVMELLFQRPASFCRKIEKRQEPMGLNLKCSEKMCGLLILEVGPGAVSRSAPDVKAGDRIDGVNGIRGRPQQLVEAIKESDTILLDLSRTT